MATSEQSDASNGGSGLRQLAVTEHRKEHHPSGKGDAEDIPGFWGVFGQLGVEKILWSPIHEGFLSGPDSVQSIMLDESKDVENLESDPKRNLMSKLTTTSVDQKKKFLKSFDQAKTSYQKKFGAIVKAVAQKSLVPSKGMKQLDVVIRNAFMEAYKYGFLSTGSKVSQNFKFLVTDKDFVAKAAEAEKGYAKSFLNQVASGKTGRMDFRIEMYSKTLDSMFTSGWLASLPTDSRIWWVIHSKESCPDCKALAKGSPYTLEGKNALKTTPRSGSTKCLSNCKCTLRVMLPGTGDQTDTDFFNEPAVVVNTKDSKVVKSFEDLYSELNLVRQKIELENDFVKKAALVQERRDLNGQIVDLAKAKKVSVQPRFSIEDVKAAVVNMDPNKLVEHSVLQKGKDVAVVKNSFNLPGTVTSVSKKSLELETPYGQLKIPDPAKVLLFSVPKNT